MSKYNKGDKFILEVDSEVYEGDMANLSPKYYTLKGLSGLAIIEESLDKLQKCETELSWDEAYNKGLEDAWKLMKKIIEMYSEDESGALGTFFTPINEASKNLLLNLMKDFTPQEALTELEAYEKEQEIKVGDIVYNDDTMEEGVVTFIDEARVFILYDDGSCGSTCGQLTKTGRHIDITSVLEQLRSE